MIITFEEYAADWRYEVLNGDTKLSFEEWLEHRLEADETNTGELA